MDAVQVAIAGMSAGCQQLQLQTLRNLQSFVAAFPNSHKSSAQFTWGSSVPSSKKNWAGSDPRLAAKGAMPPRAFMASITLSGPANVLFDLGLASGNARADGLVSASADDTLFSAGTAQKQQPAKDQLLWRSSARTLPLASLTAAVGTASTSSVGGCCGTGSAGEKQQGKQQQQQSARVAQWMAAGDLVRVQDQEEGGRQQLLDFTGTWIKDKERSDSMEAAMNLMRLNGIVRQAVKLVRGVQISQDQQDFTFTVFSFISWFKVKEVYPWSGEERQYRRRDLRRGKAQGHVEPQGQQINVRLRWSEPLGGNGTDHFRLISKDELHIESVINVAGQTATYKTVYTRRPDRRQGEGEGSSSSSTSSTSSSSTSSSGTGSDMGSDNGGEDDAK